MALTRTQLITLHQVLGIPYSDDVFRIKDIDNMLALKYQPVTDHQARLQIQGKLLGLESDPDALADLVDLLDRWYCLLADSTSMDAGGVGPATGISFDLALERNMLRERIITIVPFSREWMMNEMGKTQRANMSIRVVR